MNDPHLKWEVVENEDGRVVYQLHCPSYSFPVGGVVDYTPAVPPYEAIVRLPLVDRKWFEDLQEAQQFVTAQFMSYLIKRASK